MPERKKLLEGFKKFRKKYYEDSDIMEELAKDGAHPEFFIFHCIDPRSGAGTVFSSGPGALFGQREMAALVPPYEEGSSIAAALSFAIREKKIKHIVVLGHTHCGGVEALVNDVKDKDISGWMNKARKAFDRAKAKVGDHDHHALAAETEKQLVIQSLKNLMTYPVVKEAFEKGEITLNGWLFDIECGDVLGYDPGTNDFESLIETPPDTNRQDLRNVI